LIFGCNFGYPNRIGPGPKGNFWFEPAMARLIDIATLALSAPSGPADRVAAPLSDLSLLLTGPWAV